MAHGRDTDIGKAARIAAAAGEASLGLDEDRSRLYVDLVLASLSEAARRELQAMDPAKYEYQSEFARRYVAQGRIEGKAEGRLEGRADLLVRLLTLRFGPLSDDVRTQISAASIEQLDAIGERLLAARSLQEALGRG
jgi:predicted transposase YdaD